jgi:hypothetical protein
MKSTHCSVAFAIFALSLTAGCGLENSVVGGRCRDGMELSGNTCVARDPGATLVTPGDPPIGTFGNHPGDAPPAAQEIDPSRVDPPLSPPAPLSPIAPPYTPPVEVPPPPVLPPPPLVCAAPLVACHDACIPVDSDPANCGACGKVCASNICIAGECQGATPGDVVLIGHDFTAVNSQSAQTRVLVNALSIPTTDPIRVLSYEDGASVVAVIDAKAVAAYGIKNREIRFTTAAAAADLASPALGKDYDIVLLHDASAGDAAAIGASWATSLDTFTRKGGVVVALDNGTSPMPTLLSSSGMLTVASHTTLPSSTHLLVTGAADVIGAQVLSPYAAFGSPVSFQGLPAQSADLSWVVRAKNVDDSAGDAVVVHRVVRDAD